MRIGFRIEDPESQRDAAIVRALRGERVPDLCVFRPSGKLYPFGVAKRLDGAQVPIKCGGVELGVATVELREDGLYLTGITRTPAGIEWAKNPKIDMQPIPFVLPERTL